MTQQMQRRLLRPSSNVRLLPGAAANAAIPRKCRSFSQYREARSNKIARSKKSKLPRHIGYSKLNSFRSPEKYCASPPCTRDDVLQTHDDAVHLRSSRHRGGKPGNGSALSAAYLFGIHPRVLVQTARNTTSNPGLVRPFPAANSLTSGLRLDFRAHHFRAETILLDLKCSGRARSSEETTAGRSRPIPSFHRLDDHFRHGSPKVKHQQSFPPTELVGSRRRTGLLNVKSAEHWTRRKTGEKQATKKN